MKLPIKKVEKACLGRLMNIARKASGAIRVQGIASLGWTHNEKWPFFSLMAETLVGINLMARLALCNML